MDHWILPIWTTGGSPNFWWFFIAKASTFLSSTAAFFPKRQTDLFLAFIPGAVRFAWVRRPISTGWPQLRVIAGFYWRVLMEIMIHDGNPYEQFEFAGLITYPSWVSSSKILQACVRTHHVHGEGGLITSDKNHCPKACFWSPQPVEIPYFHPRSGFGRFHEWKEETNGPVVVMTNSSPWYRSLIKIWSFLAGKIIYFYGPWLPWLC